jgi:PBSX family phage terminase large subunit
MIDEKDLLDITLHKFQEQAYTSDKRITCLVSGIQGGKTRVGGLWLARRIAMFDKPGNTFLCAFPNYKLGEKSIVPWMQKLLVGCGTMDNHKMRFKLNGGGILWFASLHDPDSVEGLTNCKGILLDEGGLIKYRAWINLIGRSSFSQAPIFIATTPYNLGWLYSQIYLPWKKKERDDILVVQYTSADNPFFPREEFELQKKLLDARTFQQKYCGVFQKMAGLVYPELDENNYIEDHRPSSHFFDYYCGVDIGFSNPTAIITRAIKKDGTMDIQVCEYYKSFLNPVERCEILKQYHSVYQYKNIYVDSANPSDIALFVSAGLPATPVTKGPGSIEFGIQLHQSIIKSKVYRIIPSRNPHTMDEYSTYAYPASEDDDKTTVDSKKESPVKVFDHSMDANRYVTMMTQHLRSKALESTPLEQTHLQKLLSGAYSQQPQADAWYN